MNGVGDHWSGEIMRKLFLMCVLTLLAAPAALPASGPARSHTVLVIYSSDRAAVANIQIDEKLRETLAVNTNLSLKYLTEYLDYPRYGDEPDEAYDKLVSDFFRTKYSSQPIDVVIAGGPQAFRFLLRHK